MFADPVITAGAARARSRRCIACELTARGHEVRWYTVGVRPQVEAAGLVYELGVRGGLRHHGWLRPQRPG